MRFDTRTSAIVLAALFAPAASATDGYFAHGYGMSAIGMGGAATAMAKDAFGGANNPASMVWVGSRLDVGLNWFSPKRSAERSGSQAGLNGSAESGSNNFYIPEFGYNRMLGANMSVGVSVYGNGGMNTDYPGGQIGAASACAAGFNPGGPAAAPYNLLCGSGRLGVDLMQLVIAPTFAMKVSENNSFGVSPLIGYQRFKAEGLDGFFGFTPNPFGWPGNNSLTNRGYDSSHGFGLRVGWMGRMSDSLTFGATYATKMRMSEFDKYKDLFAQQGGFDLPENFDLGIAFKPAPNVTIAADYQRINYSGINSVANASTNNSAFPGGGGAAPGTVGSLGCDSCRGFGWSNVDVVKLGIEYQYNPNLVLRAGYNHTDNPIQGRDVTFNFLAPGVVQDHLTAGFTYSVSRDSELTMAYMHAFKNSVTANSLFNGFGVPAGQEKIQMYENSLGIAYGLKFR